MVEDEAKEEADWLVEQLGEGWKPYVHENLGWHYSAKSGNVSVHEGHYGGKPRGTYQAYLHGPYSHDGIKVESAYFSSPQMAVSDLLAKARVYCSRKQAEVDALLLSIESVKFNQQKKYTSLEEQEARELYEYLKVRFKENKNG